MAWPLGLFIPSSISPKVFIDFTDPTTHIDQHLVQNKAVRVCVCVCVHVRVSSLWGRTWAASQGGDVEAGSLLAGLAGTGGVPAAQQEEALC